MKKHVIVIAVVLGTTVHAQDFPGCVKPPILPTPCKDFKTANDVNACTSAILSSDNEWHAWQQCAISAIEKRRGDELQQVLEAAKLARDSRLGFVRRAIQ